MRDAHFALRNLSRTPGFTLVVILTLALGIGASTAIFSIVNAVVLRPLPYPDPDRLVRITSELRTFGATDTGLAASELFDYQARTDVFAGVTGLLPVNANVTSGGTPERVEMMLVSVTYFDVLGVAPAHGRTFGREDDTAGVADVAVVSDGFFRRRLGADPDAVGRTIVIDSDPIRIVGVMPAGFRHPGRTVQTDVDVWSPSGFRTGLAPQSRGRRRLDGALARLQPGVTLEQAQSRLAEYGIRVSREFPADYPAQDGWAPRVIALHEHTTGGVAAQMFMLLSGVALLLLVACVNVAHLVLARSSGRRQEMAIRHALGASTSRLAWQLVTESALLAAAGGALGLLVASWGLRGLLMLAPGRLWRIEDVRLDGAAVLVAALISGAVTLLFGLIPALHARRAGTFAALKDGGPGRGTDGRAGRTRDLLVGVEVAMATVLLVGAGLLVRSVVELLRVPVGFETERLVTARIALPRPNNPGPRDLPRSITPRQLLSRDPASGRGAAGCRTGGDVHADPAGRIQPAAVRRDRRRRPRRRGRPPGDPPVPGLAQLLRDDGRAHREGAGIRGIRPRREPSPSRSSAKRRRGSSGGIATRSADASASRPIRRG